MVQGRGLGTTETEATHYRRFACDAGATCARRPLTLMRVITRCVEAQSS
jgi:hypothetical protein